MTRYAVISKDSKAFFLGRYLSLKDAYKAIDGRWDLYSIYKEIIEQEGVKNLMGLNTNYYINNEQ
jgi:hypothetical protein